MPFICYRLLILPDGSRDLLIKINHAMYDGTLLCIFDDEFKGLFRKQPVPETVSFHDYVSYMHLTDRQKSLKFWQELLQNNGAPFPKVEHPLASALTMTTTDRKVDLFAANCGVTVLIVFQTAFTLLLCRLSGRTDVTYDNLITGRNVDAFNDETRSLFWKTTEHGNVSLKDIYQSLGQNRDESASRALFLFQPFDQPASTTNLVEKHMRGIVMGLSKVQMPIDYVLHLEVSKAPKGHTVKFKFDPQWYAVDQFEKVTEAFLEILEKMMSHSRSKVIMILWSPTLLHIYY
ncbi:putative hybrid PKS-NRPS biosynthetic cluster [Aspergillus viridinutans]|uniref:Hybrid PKS-NRPS biosynthetic cluster n=1 Tax=Aspergillus viridinutans TaxID=75553 RepID=A0A9P3BU13_ASPVI|nr:putative hybrid PKS-NRPS biosynthetic cluster [Aspergillus viridinutans]GIJ99600.1 putative hybrid PKS-NRPS biosynthetic cluster [Aspergillus viridinutans]